MVDTQYDVSPQYKRIFEEKQKLRSQARAYYMKQITSPFRPAEGHIFDPVLFRYMAMQPYQYEYFRPNARNFSFLLGYIIVPIMATYYLNVWDWKRKEKLYRTGQIAYKDRDCKLLL